MRKKGINDIKNLLLYFFKKQEPKPIKELLEIHHDKELGEYFITFTNEEYKFEWVMLRICCRVGKQTGNIVGFDIQEQELQKDNLLLLK